MQDIREEIDLGGQKRAIATAPTRKGAKKRRRRRQDRESRGSRAGWTGEGTGRSARSKPKASRELTLEIAAMEYVWLWDRRHGISIEAIAAREGVNVGRVRFGVTRARAQEKGAMTTTNSVRPPRLVPLFPIGPYTPVSACAHNRPIAHGSALCCMVCHCSGMDRHPALRRDPRTDPAPEPKPNAPPEPADLKRETRKERRQRLFGARP